MQQKLGIHLALMSLEQGSGRCLSCNTCCDTGLGFHPKGDLILSPFTTGKGFGGVGIYSYPAKVYIIVCFSWIVSRTCMVYISTETQACSYIYTARGLNFLKQNSLENSNR